MFVSLLVLLFFFCIKQTVHMCPKHKNSLGVKHCFGLMDAPDLCVKCLLMDLRSKCCFGGLATKKKSSSLIFRGNREKKKQEGEKGRDWGGETESWDKRVVCYWATPAPMDSQQDSKTHSASNGSHEDFFFSVYKPHLFIFMSLWFIYFLLSQHPLLCRWNHVRVTPSRASFHLPPPCLLIPLQLKIKLL